MSARGRLSWSGRPRLHNQKGDALVTSENYLSYSQIADWLRCRQLWRYNWEQRLRPKIKARQPELGDAVHRMIATWLRIGDVDQGWTDWRNVFLARAGRDLFDEELELVDALEIDAAHTALRAVKFIQETGLTTAIWNGIPMIEQRVSFPLAGWKGFVGVFDWVAQDLSTGMEWLIDWKVRDSFQTQLAEDVSLQMGLYSAAAQLKGRLITGSRTLQIKAGAMKMPTLNQNGSMSRADIRTDWFTYRTALEASGLNPDEYEDMKAKLDAKVFQDWLMSYRSQTELWTLWNEIAIPVSREILSKRRRIVRNMNFFNCVTCPAQELCLASVRGHDTEYIVAREFEREGEDEITKGLIQWRSISRR